ncbi:acyl-CoA dehydrogenase [Natrialba magadii ATCC 43099]|uniref:Acyl-CoA dehydrogenase n=1 Tax=Natrialba magadii (strain ATCC 43099 / DSM 3394 / CCM 3739 / CIP 104546 / IAM 13178 / JCM 8861 / NBRC 102185 / NCIMB 2190 / MS3) TaxID=547559 RepID=D3STD7_NATMM|nr:acyl-CoA dehydrogenase family protein [Natrialba magadii]ADD07004.1 acyl-CoA dehydrogenase [Natrialba magadii ATCC 43099]ELY28853.1 acyl-CoA dehydrogenase domain-containing protein [Natrialba magadii ATCC 43099]
MATLLRDAVQLTESQQLVRSSIGDICADFDHEYWRTRAETGEYPHKFVDELVEHGWMGILVPEAYGGAGMGTQETVVMMEEIAANGGGFSAAQAVHGGVYNSVPIVEYGGEDLKSNLLPRVADGEASIQAFGLTEPNAGSNSTAIETRAEASQDGDEYVINGQKIWTSRVDVSDYLVLVARTTPLENVEKRTQGISMFLVDLEDAYDQDALDIESIPKSASDFVHSYELWFDDLRVPAENLIGVEGEGFYQVLDGLNEERLVIAAECLGLGRLALERAVQYATDREVFGNPIGSNQAIQHPLAEAYARLQAAKQLTYNAADRAASDENVDLGAYANAAKFLAADAAYQAADAAVQTHGGFGIATEYDVERYFREARLTRLVPITQQLALNYLGEKVLGLPRSY